MLARTATLIILVTLLSSLSACRSRPPAPVTEAGQRLIINEPVVVASSRMPESNASTRRAPTANIPTPTPAPRNTGGGNSAGASMHRVQRGETLFSIAYQYDLDYRSLAIANNLRPPYTIFIDQELNLNVEQSRNSGGSSPNLSVGTPVGNNDVAAARGVSTRTGGVMREPIDAGGAPPDWQWPQRGRILRGFNESGSEGLDISGSRGDPVYAAGAGDVVYAGNNIQGAGNLIILRHNDNYLSAYGHNSRLLVEVGDHLEGGEQIAEMGVNAAGVPMLHFEIRSGGKAIDPLALLPR